MIILELYKIPFKFKMWDEPLAPKQMEFGSQMEKRLTKFCDELLGDRWHYQIKYYKDVHPNRMITGLVLRSEEDLFLFNLAWK